MSIHSVCVRIIKDQFLKDAAKQHSKAASFIDRWREVVKNSSWEKLTDVRKTYPSADEVKVDSGKPVVVFNAGGNNYRLIAAIHYNRGKVYTLRFLTHAEYDKNDWKKQL